MTREQNGFPCTYPIWLEKAYQAHKVRMEASEKYIQQHTPDKLLDGLRVVKGKSR